MHMQKRSTRGYFADKTKILELPALLLSCTALGVELAEAHVSGIGAT